MQVDDIRDEGFRDAARRFEAATGARIADCFPGEPDNLVELFLILNSPLFERDRPAEGGDGG